MNKPDWLARRNRTIHITIRDVDCRDFDVPRFIADLRRLHVTFFSFFAGGYVTTYPTQLRYQRMSPQLGGRDLTGEIIQEAHRYGIKAFPMIDLGMLPELAAAAHPEWCAVDVQGKPYQASHGAYRACILGGYVREYSREMVGELVSRYAVDGIKFGGASLGFQREICYCAACRQRYRQERERDIPKQRDWSHPEWHEFVDWRVEKAVETVELLTEMVKSFDRNLPVTGNSVCFGDPEWTIGSSLDIERIAAIEDAAQIEVQTRLRLDEANDQVRWQYLRWPAESASYMDAISDRPFWVVASYFIAWPWRRSAAPYHEQKAYLALGAAHGASLMVNLSGGPPAVHEDTRGFQAVEEVYGFMASNREFLEDDESGANVGLVYSHETLFHYGQDKPGRYVDELRGFEQALYEAHIPFDIISSRMVADGRIAKYRLLILPSTACLSEKETSQLERFLQRGGALLASYETGLYHPNGAPRPDLLLADLLGISYRQTSHVTDPHMSEPQQAYMRVTQSHPLVNDIKARLLPAQGRYCQVECKAKDATVPLALTAAFRVFPEGLSYPERQDPAHPMLVVREFPSGGRTIYFAGHVGKTFIQCRLPDLGALIAQAVRWAANGQLPLRVQGPSSLHCSLRVKEGLRMVHCVNLTGSARFSREVVPVHDVRIGVPKSGSRKPQASLLGSRQPLIVAEEDGWWWANVPRVNDYDVVVFKG